MKNNNLRLSVLIFLPIFLTACKNNSTPNAVNTAPNANLTAPTPSALEIQTLSPDSAVKTWWRYLDLANEQNVKDCKKFQDEAPAKHLVYLPQITQADVLKVLIPTSTKKQTACREDVFSREIQEVKTESETRALVFALIKNITPIPTGAEPDKIDIKWREDGFRFKYLLEKTSSGWKVSQVYRYNEYNKTLDRDVWQSVYAFSDKPNYPSIVNVQ